MPSIPTAQSTSPGPALEQRELVIIFISFEYAVLCKFSSLFQTDSLQFGFSLIGCSDDLFTKKSVIDYFTKHGCTLTVSALDMSKVLTEFLFMHFFKVNGSQIS